MKDVKESNSIGGDEYPLADDSSQHEAVRESSSPSGMRHLEPGVGLP